MEKIIASIELTLEEVFQLESVLTAVKKSCLDKEFASIYYDLTDKKGLSEERNYYNNLLSIALNMLSNLKQIIFAIEDETCKLQQDTNNSRRQVTAQCTADECS
ncbi:MAG: hypothetical protein NC408_06765 [Candidatus Gastranaerophilales bacterium]|nr:hypothetical protein [Candidatus Gastranaerophilales bacterium]MCM1073011.1 hypothetical protein [Bacteroides sp.]